MNILCDHEFMYHKSHHDIHDHDYRSRTTEYVGGQSHSHNSLDSGAAADVKSKVVVADCIRLHILEFFY